MRTKPFNIHVEEAARRLEAWARDADCDELARTLELVFGCKVEDVNGDGTGELFRVTPTEDYAGGLDPK